MNKTKYPGKYPQEPWQPTKPNINNFIGHESPSEPKCIYKDYEYIHEDMDIEEYWENYDEAPPKKPSKGIREKLSLQDILDLAPPGTEPKNIIFDLYYPRHIEYIRIGFNLLKRNESAEQKAYEAALKKYEEQYEKYKLDYAEYIQNQLDFDNWKKQQQIAELEDKLNKLKSK